MSYQILAGFLFASALTLSAQTTYLIDFNTTRTTSTFPGGASAWNVYAADTDIEGSAVTIADTSGSTATGITLIGAGSLTDSGNTETLDNGGPSWVTEGNSSNAAGDYFFTSTGSGAESFTLTFGNLVEDSQISLDLFSSRYTDTATGYFEYSIDDGSTWYGFSVLEKDGTATTDVYWLGEDTSSSPYRGKSDGDALGRYMNEIITLSGTTSLQIKVTDYVTGSGTYTVLNALRLTVIPEPSNYALISAGFAAGLIALRRRR
ncbi:PEP-CTERM sorting domain-containing protein [Coraliomargarita parva]|uniref:PEP-CTERM sorting domain-containing protein n=1 Tax=Coraliomargarita parva TaxID=3014050 RepID=UPI0022B55627|nr:PEP-CTERM sorting domain-containing protein [Coraliomargarita parva]